MGLFAKSTPQPAAQPVAQPKPPERPRFQIGPLPIPHSMEHRGWLLSGAPGTGKTVVITGMLDTIIPRGDSGFVADRSGIYLSRYYNPERDVILSPLDARGVDWSPLAEFEGEDNYSAQTIAQSIIPDGSGESAQWNAGAQIALTAILEHCFDNHLTNSEILRLAVRADLDELSEIFKGKAAEAQVAPGNEKMFGSIRAIIAAYIMPYQRLAPDAGRHSFSIKNHIKSGNQGWLFFNYTTPQMMPLRKILCAMADIWCEAVMTLPADESRRQWLVLDEFSSIGRMNGIANYVANARKHGGCSILGVQSIYQGYDEYTENTFLGMISSLNNQLILCTADGKTAEYLSNNLGNRQESRYIHSTNASQGSSSTGASSNQGESYAQQVVVEKNFLEGELLSLPDLRAVIKLAGAARPTVIDINLPARKPPVAEPFIARVRAPAPTPAPAPAQPPAPAAEAAGLEDLDAALQPPAAPAPAAGIDL
ncbi:MAG: type IV secretion system DNA-binding domain-containing protein [Betaproteobacteria bacterium]|nr:type IV secretion system DNA-binding domain-containing protein [Betaproteobacteria bacterium]